MTENAVPIKVRRGYTTLDLQRDARLLEQILAEVRAPASLADADLAQILRRHPLPDGRVLPKSQLLAAYRRLCAQSGLAVEPEMVRRLRVKPTRTISGVAPVSVLTRPHPCPGECIFCPQVGGMPKSYLPDEPGAMRAASYRFDPYGQTAGRVGVMSQLGHHVDKVELLILGGTWSAYPEHYQEWFIRRCLDALNGTDSATLVEAQLANARAERRNVGIVIETRPDSVTPDEVRRLRWLGVTKVQLGVQSLNDEILGLNQRGHTAADTRHAMRLLRLAGFKVVVHWMPNLLGTTPDMDARDFGRLWEDPALRPDELKIYPTALLPGTRLEAVWRQGEYQPYDEEALVSLLVRCKTMIPPYCRLNRLMRDIPAPNILAGVKRSNLRQTVQEHMRRAGLKCNCIRCREVRGMPVDIARVRLNRLDYATDATREAFVQALTRDDRLAGFARLSLPLDRSPLQELEECAVIRELHVYGEALPLATERPGAAQHAGLGTRLLAEAERIARDEGYLRLAVIASVGTRPYYGELGYGFGQLYMTRTL